MAEEKKDKKDTKPEAKPRHLITEIIAIAFLLLIFSRVVYVVGGFGGADISSSPSFFALIHDRFLEALDSLGVADLFNALYSTYVLLSVLLSGLFIIGIVYVLVRTQDLERIWRIKINPDPAKPVEVKAKNERWVHVVNHMHSATPSDWRLAILECDIILDELLDSLGIVGGTIGEKLKAMDSVHFRTINDAWEAHKIRNAIAHEGQDFALTQREAHRIASLYERVFREFDYI